MARFVMANRRAGRRGKAEKAASRDSIDMAMDLLSASIDVASDFQAESESASRIVQFDASPAEISSMAANLSPDVILEPEILRWPGNYVPADFIASESEDGQAVAAGSGETLDIKVTGGGSALADCEVILFLRGLGGTSSKVTGTTSATGKVRLSYSSFYSPSALIAVPAGNFWPMVERGPVDGMTVECPDLPQDGPLSWWHEELGIHKFSTQRGRGIKVGVIDTGVGPNGCLSHVVDIGSIIHGVYDPNGGADADSHGSHVCGIIGAKPKSSGQFGGVAPGCKLFSCRVFPPNQGANQGDIAEAIERLTDNNQVDLINMSLSGNTPSHIEHDAIKAAFEVGTICFCAAGNKNGHVRWPAAFPETVAVSALGKLGWGPTGSLPQQRIPQQSDRFGNGNLYLANFSCFGDEITCSAAGVGYISTVPERFGLTQPYASMGGTSMSSPSACGAAAVILSENQSYLDLPRDETRSQMARSLLIDSCISIGLNSKYQGRGVPYVD